MLAKLFYKFLIGIKMKINFVLILMVFRSIKGLQGDNDKFQRVSKFTPEGYRKEETLHTLFIAYVYGHIEKV